jgi:tripeptide aminopeptidase
MELEQVLQLLDQEHQVHFFLETARIAGVSLHERTFAEYIEPILTEMGFQVEYDGAGDKLGSESGNLIAYWPGTDPEAEPILFSAHMDTILDSSGCQPEIREGVIHADGRSILGSDDRSAISAYIEGIRAVQASHMPCGPIELLFTIDEQHGLCGARELDVKKSAAGMAIYLTTPGM